MPSTDSGTKLLPPTAATISFLDANALVAGMRGALVVMCIAPGDARRDGTVDAATSWSGALSGSRRRRALAAVIRAVSAAALPVRLPDWLTVAAGLVWAAALLLPRTTVRAWLLGAAGYGMSLALDVVAYRPARWRQLPKRDTIAVHAVFVAFGIGLWVRSGLVAAVLLFVIVGCFGPAGVLAGRSFGRVAKGATALATAAGVTTSLLAPRLAPAVAIALMAWIGYSSVRDDPPADIGWAVARSAAAVARFAAAVAAFDILADWRTAGAFRFEVWAEVALPLAVGALVVFGLAVAASDSRLRPGGVAIAATAAGIPYAFVGTPPASTVCGVAFGLAWVIVGGLCWFEARPRFREARSAHAASSSRAPEPTRALA